MYLLKGDEEAEKQLTHTYNYITDDEIDATGNSKVTNANNPKTSVPAVVFPSASVTSLYLSPTVALPSLSRLMYADKSSVFAK